MRYKFVNFLMLMFAFASANAQSLSDGLRDIDFEKYEASRSVFLNLISQDPKNGDYWYYLGQTYTNLLNQDSAQICYNEGIKVAPMNPANYAGLGELELINENKVKAKEYFDKALSFSKNRQDIYTDIRAITLVATSMVGSNVKMLDEAEALILMGYEQDKKNYDLLVAGGDVYLEKNDGGNAATFYERAIAIDPKNPKAYTRVAGIWIRVKNFDSGQNDLNRAFEKDPNYAPAWKSQAELYYSKRMFEKAKEAYATYLKNSEPSLANRIRFARLLFLSKEYDEALSQIDEVQKIDKQTLLLYRLRAFSISEITETKPDVEKAKSGLTSMEYYFAKQAPEKIAPSDYLYLGKLQAKVGGKDSLAVINIQKAMELNPGNPDLYVDIAKLYNKMKRFDDAAANFEIYISRARRVTAADYFLLGKAYYFGRNFGKADTAFAKVNEMKPEYAEAYYYRGMSNYSLYPDCKTGSAVMLLEKYITLLTADKAKFDAQKDKLKTNLVYSYSSIASCYLENDNNTKAKEYFQKVLEVDPTNENAKKAVQGLK